MTTVLELLCLLALIAGVFICFGLGFALIVGAVAGFALSWAIEHAKPVKPTNPGDV